jgi:hypothetical protein
LRQKNYGDVLQQQHQVTEVLSSVGISWKAKRLTALAASRFFS